MDSTSGKSRAPRLQDWGDSLGFCRAAEVFLHREGRFPSSKTEISFLVIMCVAIIWNTRAVF